MMTREPMDLRHQHVWERAATVLERADGLTPGQSFEFYTELDPRALMTRLEQLRPGQFAFDPRHIGEAEWHVMLERIVADVDASSLRVALRRSPIFNRLDAKTRLQIAAAMTERQAKKNEVIRSENERCETLGFILDGTLASFVGAGARERLLVHLFPFDTFGQLEYFDGGLSLGRIVVLSKTARYATIPYSTVSEMLGDNTAFISALATTTAQRNRALVDALAAHVSQPIIARVAAALMPYAAPEQGMHPALPPLPNMTQAQVAASAGTVKEVAARAIAELERLEALRRERGHIRYLDRTKLLETIE
jgi:CRP-like cAMP-binding protein/uncharacterized protein (DUF2249 family)